MLWAYGITGRLYGRPPGRGPFGEVGIVRAHPRLRVTDSAGATATRRAALPMLSWGAGWRSGLGGQARWRGVFGELALRSSVFLRERHLYTDPTPPAGSTEEALTDRSWYFGRGAVSSSFYVVGVGRSF